MWGIFRFLPNIVLLLLLFSSYSLTVEENESEDQQGGVGLATAQTGNVELLH